MPAHTNSGWARLPGSPADRLFLALTFVLVFVVVLLCRDTTAALVIIGLLLALPALCLAAGEEPGRYFAELVCGDRSSRRSGAARQKEGYWPLPGAAAPYAAAVPPSQRALRYPGAIDADEYDEHEAWGHRDRTLDDSDSAPVGNPYDLSRTYSEPAAGPCVDDEANQAEITGDEGMVYHGLHRNDATRVAAGTMNRRRDLQKYLDDEVSVAQDREWWGRHEY
jgi:hypothetical protein